MSEIKCICPFCKMPLFPEPYSGRFGCTKHDYHVDYINRKAWFGNKASTEFKESQEFLHDFFTNKPLFAISPVKLFKEGFSKSTVKYYGNDTVSLDNFVSAKDIRYGYLIAGNGLVAHHLLRHVCVMYEQHCEVSPLNPVYTDVESYLFLLHMSDSSDCTYKITNTLYAYLLPTLESMCSVICEMPFHNIVPLNDEMVLYSAIFMRPQDNIKWDVDNLRRNIRNFIIALTDFTPTVEQLPFKLEEHFVNFPEALVTAETKAEKGKSLYIKTLLGNYSTAPNEGMSGFDIMEKNYHTVKGPGNKMTSNALTAFVSSHNSLAELFDKYAKLVTPMGIDKKRMYLKHSDDQSSPNVIVLSFWRAVNEILKKES